MWKLKIILLTAMIIPCLTGFGTLEAKDTKATKTIEKKVADIKADANKVSSAMPKVNINTADLDTLTQLKGIGEKKAEAIIKYREQVGKFKAVEDLLNVDGIGPKILEKIKPLLQF